jgi:putative SOS response-associated peptidase YedK
MCGRFTQTRSWRELVELYRLADGLEPLHVPPRYNIAPTQDVPVVRRRADAGERELALLRWGLIHSRAKDMGIGARMINARAETVHEKPAFRSAFRQRRCLVVADGFYEWQKQPRGPKQPYFITVAGDRSFAFAGLWERWNAAGGPVVETCTIVTTQANELLRPIHDRMPVILTAETSDSWLDTSLPLETARAQLKPFEGEMTAQPVGPRVNNARNDDPGCMVSADSGHGAMLLL